MVRICRYKLPDGVHFVEFSRFVLLFSCLLGFFEYEAVRRGYNAIQLKLWGVLDAARTVTIADTATNWQGRLYSLYSREDPFASPLPTKLIQLGVAGQYYLSFRGVFNSGVDRQVGVANSEVAKIMAGVVLVHKLEVSECLFFFFFCFNPSCSSKKNRMG